MFVVRYGKYGGISSGRFLRSCCWMFLSALVGQIGAIFVLKPVFSDFPSKSLKRSRILILSSLWIPFKSVLTVLTWRSQWVKEARML